MSVPLPTSRGLITISAIRSNLDWAFSSSLRRSLILRLRVGACSVCVSVLFVGDAEVTDAERGKPSIRSSRSWALSDVCGISWSFACAF